MPTTGTRGGEEGEGEGVGAGVAGVTPVPVADAAVAPEAAPPIIAAVPLVEAAVTAGFTDADTVEEADTVPEGVIEGEAEGVPVLV